MNEKNEKPENMPYLPPDAIEEERESIVSEDEPYSQLNKTSFEQDFKALLGHYKNDQGPNRESLPLK